MKQKKMFESPSRHCTEVGFFSFFSGIFITAIIVNTPERKPLCTAQHRYETVTTLKSLLEEQA